MQGPQIGFTRPASHPATSFGGARGLLCPVEGTPEEVTVGGQSIDHCYMRNDSDVRETDDALAGNQVAGKQEASLSG
jgi:hypothetical protein